MTKAASFLLWYDDFAKIRDYLLQHVAWMISDASGIPPSYAEPAGFDCIAMVRCKIQPLLSGLKSRRAIEAAGFDG